MLKVVLCGAAQCGGKGGSCVGAACADAQFAGSCCVSATGSQGFYCQRSNEWYYQCVPVVQRAAPPQRNCTTSVAPFMSCGVQDTCFPTRTASPDLRFTIDLFAASAPAAEAPSDAAGDAASAIDGTKSRAQPLECQEQRIPGACCAAEGTEFFSCVMVPQSAAQTPRIDYQWRCLPTATLPAAA